MVFQKNRYSINNCVIIVEAKEKSKTIDHQENQKEEATNLVAQLFLRHQNDDENFT